MCSRALVADEPKQILLLCRDHAAEERASLECYEAISFGEPSVVVPYDAHVRAPIRNEGVKQHLVIHVAGQLSNKDLEM